MLVNDTIVATLISDLNYHRCMYCAATIVVSAGNLTENTSIVRFIYNMAYHSRRMLTHCNSKKFPLIVDMFMLTISSEAEDAML